MFHKLQIKMTLINVGVMMMLFAILITGVYMLSQYNLRHSSDFFLQKISEKVLANELTDLPRRTNRENAEAFPKFLPPPPRPNFFFVKTDSANKILSHSSGITVTEEELAELVQRTLHSGEASNALELYGTTFMYLHTPINATNGSLIVFNDLSDEQAAMQSLLMNLLLVALFCSLLSFAASFFMAKHAIKPIQYALTQQENFVSDASHELRTPITIIQTNLDIINGALRGDTIENNQNWLNNIQGETTRMTELINSLLFLARADANQQLFEKEYFSLNQTVVNAVTPFQVIAQSRMINLTTDLTGALTAFGDPTRLKQALTLLLDNALRHTPARGTVVVACQALADALCLTVADTGEGIAEEHFERLFDRFYQADSSRHKGGAGLGLSMAKWIIEQHGGTISVASALAQGTTVTIRLPLPPNH